MSQIRWLYPGLNANPYDTSQRSNEDATDPGVSPPGYNSNMAQEEHCLPASASLWDFPEARLSDISSNLHMPSASSTPHLDFINNIDSFIHDPFINQPRFPSVLGETDWRMGSTEIFCQIYETHWDAYDTPVDGHQPCHSGNISAVNNLLETQGDNLMSFWPAPPYSRTSGLTEHIFSQDSPPSSPTPQRHSTPSYPSEAHLMAYDSLDTNLSSSLWSLDRNKSFGRDATSHNELIVQSPNSKASIHDIDPPDSDMNTPELGLVPQKQDLKHPDNLYVPRWIRGNGRNREAWCGCGRWLSLKRSTYWYHKNFVHGVTISGRPFPEPVDFGQRHESTAREGLCKTCERWIPLGGSKRSDTSWYRHIYKCDSMAALKRSSL